MLVDGGNFMRIAVVFGIKVTVRGLVQVLAFAVSSAIYAVTLPVPKWISGDTQAREKPAPVLERTFVLKRSPGDAVFEVAVAGWCEGRVNGILVGEDVLSPVTGQPDKRIPVLRLDVASLLRVGENRISVLLGNGWFNCFTKSTWLFSEGSWLAAPQIRGRLVVDGETSVITDGNWCA